MHLPSNEWIAEQAQELSSDKGADSVGALAWNLSVAFRRWAEQAEEPWRKYDGKGRPVPNGTPIEIRQRDGKVRRDAWFTDATWRVGGSFAHEDVEFWRPVSSQVPETRS